MIGFQEWFGFQAQDKHLIKGMNKKDKSFRIMDLNASKWTWNSKVVIK